MSKSNFAGNVPYVKQYDEHGVVLNPIKGNLVHQYPNRTERRAEFKKQRPNNLRKGTLGRTIQIISIKVLSTRDKSIVKKNHLGETVSVKIKKIRTVKAIAPKQIRHETNNALSRKTSMFNFYERILTLKSKWHASHPEYQVKPV